MNAILKKAATGIEGLDSLLLGGVPAKRTSLLCGGTGTGKTLISLQFLSAGARRYGEPGLYVSFDEKPEWILENTANFDFKIEELIAQKMLHIEYVNMPLDELSSAGSYDLSGLFARLKFAIGEISAKRIVLDSIENLFGSSLSLTVLRAEIRKLFHWLNEMGMTSIVTGESGEQAFTRQGLEEYLSDCVIRLDNRVDNQIATRRIRIVKYRGSDHKKNEYPFLIDDGGVSVLPISTPVMDYQVSDKRIGTGVDRLDAMFDGAGFYQGSTVLFSGSSGTGKTSFLTSFVRGACKRKEKVLFIAMEEAKSQITRNMSSIGINLEPFIEEGLLSFRSIRSTLYGLETHLVSFLRWIQLEEPDHFVLDPLTNFFGIGRSDQIKSMLVRLIDDLKSRRITSIFSSLYSEEDQDFHSGVEISSFIDTWIQLKNTSSNGTQKRLIRIRKSRGMSHVTGHREFRFSGDGIKILDKKTEFSD